MYNSFIADMDAFSLNSTFYPDSLENDSYLSNSNTTLNCSFGLEDKTLCSTSDSEVGILVFSNPEDFKYPWIVSIIWKLVIIR